MDFRWIETINLLANILDMDPQMRTDSYRRRLGVATAITFSSPVWSFASYKKRQIDAISRYQSIVKCVNDGKFFQVHTSLSAWLLRYVVASWAEEDELEWARNNIPADFRNESNVGEATHKMVSYTEHNHCGVSIHDDADFYDNKPRTLQLVAEYGAVCGGISKFGTSMSQAFGIPACLVGQPGHCAFLWWKDGMWTLSNGIAGFLI